MYLLLLLLFSIPLPQEQLPHPVNVESERILEIKKTPDFEVTGDGTSKNWELTNWLYLPSRNVPDNSLNTKVKVLYSETGIYFVFDCEDEKLTATKSEDFLNLWEEDVVEVFLWPDESVPVYFEYEISPLNYELPIIVSNKEGDLVRWQPFIYKADRKTRHATCVFGGKKKSYEKITRWVAEFFIPYKLLRPLNNVPPNSGTRWRANLYRIDYDKGKTSWSWQSTNKTFHDYPSFGVLLFE